MCKHIFFSPFQSSVQTKTAFFSTKRWAFPKRLPECLHLKRLAWSISECFSKLPIESQRLHGSRVKKICCYCKIIIWSTRLSVSLLTSCWLWCAVLLLAKKRESEEEVLLFICCAVVSLWAQISTKTTKRHWVKLFSHDKWRRLV